MDGSANDPEQVQETDRSLEARSFGKSRHPELKLLEPLPDTVPVAEERTTNDANPNGRCDDLRTARANSL